MPQPPLTIRRAVMPDAQTVADFNAAMARETEGRPLDADTLLSGVRRVLENDRLGFYLLAEANGRVVGQLLVTTEWSDWRDGLFWWIQSVYVAPQDRKTGVYRRLHEAVEQRARAAGNVCGIRLYVDADNHAAQQVYKRLGMRPTNYQLFETDWSTTDNAAPRAKTDASPH